MVERSSIFVARCSSSTARPRTCGYSDGGTNAALLPAVVSRPCVACSGSNTPTSTSAEGGRPGGGAVAGRGRERRQSGLGRHDGRLRRKRPERGKLSGARAPGWRDDGGSAGTAGSGRSRRAAAARAERAVEEPVRAAGAVRPAKDGRHAAGGGAARSHDRAPGARRRRGRGRDLRDRRIHPNATATVQAYDPAARSWRAVREFPQALNHANAAVVGDTLYVTGFYVGSSMTNTSRQVFSYEPDANEWTERMSMPDGTQRGTSCVAVVGYKDLPLRWRTHGHRPSPTRRRTTPSATRGSHSPRCPSRASTAPAGAIDGVIYIASGRAGGSPDSDRRRSPSIPGPRMYSQKAALPTPRGGVAGAVLNGRLHVFGGEGNRGQRERRLPQHRRVRSGLEQLGAAAAARRSRVTAMVPRRSTVASTSRAARPRKASAR